MFVCEGGYVCACLRCSVDLRVIAMLQIGPVGFRAVAAALVKGPKECNAARTLETLAMSYNRYHSTAAACRGSLLTLCGEYTTHTVVAHSGSRGLRMLCLHAHGCAMWGLHGATWGRKARRHWRR